MYTKVKNIFLYTFWTNNFGNDGNMLGTFIFAILDIPNYHSMIQFHSDSIGPQDTLYWISENYDVAFQSKPQSKTDMCHSVPEFRCIFGEISSCYTE